MANFELRAKAKREIECDLMNINVTFHAIANSSSDCSKKVMDECERFLEEIKNYGVPIDEIRIESDNVCKRQ